MQDGGCGGIGILVEGDVHARISAFVHQRHHPLAHAVHRVVVVGDVHRHAAAPPHGYRLAEGVQQPVSQGIAGVAHIEAAQVGYGLAHRHQFVGVAVGSRRIGQAGGEAECAVLHGLAGQLAHPGQFRPGGQPVVPAHSLHPNGGVRGHEGHVAGHPPVEEVKILPHRTPSDTGRRSAVDRRQVVQKLLQLVGRRRSVG